MSRRKQANPRPVKSVNGGRVGHGEGEEFDRSVTSPCEEDKQKSLSESVYDDEKPLTIDTSFQSTENDAHSEVSSMDHASPQIPSSSSSINKQDTYSNPPSEASSPPPPSPSIPSTLYPGTNFVFPDSARAVKRGTKVSEDLKILPVAGKNGESRFICPVCNDEMKNHHDLTIHIRQHNTSAVNSTSANRCTICGKVLSSQSSLDRHMLVHSGERPFSCRVCKMSFTTNGNMHRHMRIHSKEAELGMMPGSKTGSRRGKGGWRPRPHLPPTMQDIDLPMPESASRFQTDVPQSYAFQPVPPPPMEMSHFSPGKRPVQHDDASWESPPPPKRTMISSLAHNHSPSMLLAPHHTVHPGRNHKLFEKPEKESQKEVEHVSCPICDRVMLHSDLASHMDTHPSVPVTCHVCQTPLPNPGALLKHMADHKEETEVKVDATETNTSTKDKEESEISVGFYDLDFLDFTCPKFSLVAKAWCERMSRQPSSVYHEFVCKFCSKAFPCKAALLLHTPSHTDKKLTSCPFCDCEFVDQDIMQTHMVKHMSERVIEDTQATDPNSVSQQDYLAVFSLAPSQLVRGKESQAKKIVKEERRENNEYFPKLGHAYAPPSTHIPKAQQVQDTKARIAKEVEDLKRFFPQAANALFLNEGIHISHLAAMGLQIPPQFCQMPLLALPQHPSVHSPATSQTLTPPPGQVKQAESPFPAASPASTPPWEEGQGDPDVKGKGAFPCKYCDLVFTNQRSLKGHTRTHLGLSPYKCNLCAYSSADKSTLIRHLRTHNGERPFQCLICDFAFTTKANCERHVRKKHSKDQKDEIEQSIGYNKYVMDATTNMDAFHSPDTVCKYCGVDFKFFRALKHHLRSHSSCRQKPFLCRKCHVGFSTKANCVRHIQKQHLEVSQNMIEGMIHVNEPSSVDDLDHPTSDSPESVSPASLSSSGNFQVSPSPPAAHKVEPASMLVKLEPIPMTCSQPLDFSMGSSPFSSTPGHSRGDQPMDLSIKKKSPSPSPSPKSIQSVQPDESVLKCQERLAKFLQFSPIAFDKFRKSQKQSDEILALSDNNNNDKHNWDTSVMSAFENRNKNVNRLSIMPKLNSLNSGLDSASDLASVNKILNNTGSYKFNMFLKQSGEVEDQDRLATLRHHLLKKEPVHKESPRNSPHHSNQDSQASEPTTESDVTLLAQSYREEAEREEYQEQDEDIVKEDGEGEEEDDEEESGFVDEGEMEENKVDGDMEDKESKNGMSPGMSMLKEDKFDSPVKKKRNSYADSPHKLRCPYCPRSFPWVSSLNRHLLTHTGQKPFKCPRCPVTFSTKSNRERHLIRKHGVNMLDPASRQTMDRPYKCHLCVFSSFSTESNLLKHYHERHNGVKPEPVTDLDGSRGDGDDSNMDNSFSDEDMNMIPKSHDPMHGGSPAESGSEDHSQADMSDYSSFLQYHNQTDLDLQGEGRDEEEVDDYPDTSQTYGSGERQINPERDNYNVDKITHCWKCGKSFPSRKMLVRHLKEHNIDLPFKCYLCDASFDHRKECLVHQERHHSRDWNILREKNGVEEIDSFSTRMDQVVERHCRMGNGLMMEDNEEEEIGDEPLETVTSDYNQRKVYCSLCPKRFWSLQDLRRHMRSHTGERPFECNVCHKRFTLKHSMMRHRKKHTMTGSMSPAISDDEESVQNEDTPLAGRGRSALKFHLTSAQRDSPVIFASDQPPPSMIPQVKYGVTEEHDSDNDDDILHNLLGVDESAINTMLDSADSAAKMLGVK